MVVEEKNWWWMVLLAGVTWWAVCSCVAQLENKWLWSNLVQIFAKIFVPFCGDLQPHFVGWAKKRRNRWASYHSYKILRSNLILTAVQMYGTNKFSEIKIRKGGSSRGPGFTEKKFKDIFSIPRRTQSLSENCEFSLGWSTLNPGEWQTWEGSDTHNIVQNSTVSLYRTFPSVYRLSTTDVK